MFKNNCCDGIYNSFDIHFTSICDNKCAHCIDKKYDGKDKKEDAEPLESSDIEDEEESYGTTFGKYAGTYAQDVAGFSDDVIDDVFEGDPEAYWNID